MPPPLRMRASAATRFRARVTGTLIGPARQAATKPITTSSPHAMISGHWLVSTVDAAFQACPYPKKPMSATVVSRAARSQSRSSSASATRITAVAPRARASGVQSGSSVTCSSAFAANRKTIG